MLAVRENASQKKNHIRTRGIQNNNKNNVVFLHFPCFTIQLNAIIRGSYRLKKNSVAFSPQANYTDWATATWRNLVPTFVDRGVSRGQRGGSHTVVNLSFLDRAVTDYR
jgi:hypothetical protein